VWRSRDVGGKPLKGKEVRANPFKSRLSWGRTLGGKEIEGISVRGTPATRKVSKGTEKRGGVSLDKGTAKCGEDPNIGSVHNKISEVGERGYRAGNNYQVKEELGGNHLQGKDWVGLLLLPERGGPGGSGVVGSWEEKGGRRLMPYLTPSQ